jgi:HD-GYP domain-containing protein (c-di-GMP phosphodiesterase class II)
MSVDVVECFLSLSRSLDFTYNGLMSHHYRTTLIAMEIGKAIGLPDDKIIDLFQAAIIHDIGVISWQEKIELTQFEIKSPWQHCLNGYEILKDNPSLGYLADVILCHHDRWSGENPSGLIKNDIPLDSRIIHLADRIDILISNKLNILEQRDMIVHQVYQASGEVFDPDLTAVFQSLAVRDSFWFNIALPWSQECLNEMLPYCRTRVDLKYLLDIAKLFAQVVDAKSHFTYRHSRGVAMTARLMGEELHMPDEDCSLLEVAGLLHDLGKLAIPGELLEKPARLTTSEYNLIKQHAYYTYWLLKPLTRRFALAEWAAYHHERPNGQGYPFAKTGAELDDKSRLIAAADIFTALREERPYRTNMNWNQISRIMNQLATHNDLDKDSTILILDNQKKLDQQWAQI